MKSKDLILNRYKVGGKIQASQVQMKIKLFLLGERVDENLFSNKINSNFIFFYFSELQSDFQDMRPGSYVFYSTFTVELLEVDTI